MARKCPFNSSKRCSKPVTACETCEIRRRLGQTILTEEKTTMTITVEPIMQTREFTCPFCLYTSSLSSFQIKLKSGKMSEKRFRCPDCGLIMRRNTLMNIKTVEEFAEWMFDTSPWKRVSWEKFRKRLQDMGISYQFWDAYKKYKAKMSEGEESYADYVLRQQYEQYEKDMANQ